MQYDTSMPERHERSSTDAKPSSAEYILSGGKQLGATLQTMADFIPVPFLADFVKVAVKVVEVCESIHDDLDEIKEQKRWLLIFFRQLNKGKVDKCVGRVDAALEQFNVSQQMQLEKRVNEILEKHNQILAKQSTVTKQLDRIEDLVKHVNEPHNAPETLARQDMPLGPRIFYGREECVDKIASLLINAKTSRVCITGPGGMGKTSTALAVVESDAINEVFRKEYQFWVPCVEAKSPDALRNILYTQLRITADSYDTLNPLIKELKASKERRLLLLDNFETPCSSANPHHVRQVLDILSRLARLPHIALLVTMTSDFLPSEDLFDWQHERLKPLDAAAAHDTFKSIYPAAANKPKLGELLDAIDRIPLAITLMATDGKHSRASPEYLLQEWEKSGPDMISRGAELSMNRTIGVSMEREIVKSNPDALNILSVLSLLPSGATGSSLSWWAPKLTSYSAAIGTLRSAALVEQEAEDFKTSRISVRPTIKSYMSRQNRISDEVHDQVHDACYAFVLAHKSAPNNEAYKADLMALADEEVNIQGILMQIGVVQDLRPRALDALIAFSLYQFHTKPSTVVALHALKIARAEGADRHVAEVHQCLGKILFRLDRYEKACDHFKEAYRLFKLESLPGGPDRLCAGECAMVHAETWMRMCDRDQDEIGQLVSQANDDLSHDASQKYHVARGLRGRGLFLWWKNDREKALEILSVAKSKLEELNCPASVSKCLLLMARITQATGNDYLTARSIAGEALTKAEQAGDQHQITEVLTILGGYLIGLSLQDNDETLYVEAFKTIERSLQMSRSLGAPVLIGRSLELLGYICAAKMDLPASRRAYEGAREQFSKMGVTVASGDGGNRCTSNLKKLDGMEALDETGFLGLEKPLE
ncbi:hypothetical protein C8R44DRAFT_959176 [Mycena epipterygia]|nr:hypothetical protein C8R44DRAFT_959176 [Mycena epipterygia]